MKKINGIWHTPTDQAISLYDLEGPIEDGVSYLQGLAADLAEPALEVQMGYDHSELLLSGYRPATEAEINRHERKLAKDRERAAREAKQAKEAKERKREAEKIRALEVAWREFPELFKAPPAEANK